MRRLNYGVCSSCRARVPAEHVIREGKVFIRKHCPDCGPTEALLSTDPARWQRKRDICGFDPDSPLMCTLDCERCGRDHHPRMVFLDVTNRCNMNCPICIANIPGMGFEFHPPLDYFERVLTGLGEMEPKPVVQLFGGEPTMRDDLFEIIAMARGKGLDVRIVTNGLKLADEEFCKRVCEAKVHVLLAFDGRDPKIYERLRKNAPAYYKKVHALENLAKYSQHKNTIMCCVARNVNDAHMRDLIDFCHEGRSYIKCLHLIPLTETWSEGDLDDGVVATTLEDVEQIIDEAFPEGRVEFLPMGPSESLRKSLSFFGTAPLKFGGVHPNCETAAYLLSDGRQYWPLSRYLRRPLDEIAEEVVSRARKLDAKLTGLRPARFFQRWWGRFLVLKTFGGLVLGSLNSRTLLKGNRAIAIARILGGALAGRRLRDLLRKHTNVQSAMLMVVLPFEEDHSVESARLQECPSAFAYEDPDTGEVATVPVCLWSLYKNDVQRKIMARYEPAALQTRPVSASGK